MSRTDDLEKQEREKRDEQSGKLRYWADELRALGQQLWDEDQKNGWRLRILAEPQLTVLVTIGGAEFARFVRNEVSIIGVFQGREPQLFSNRYDAFDAAVKLRMARQKLRGVT